jgi:hypothetical protein
MALRLIKCRQEVGSAHQRKRGDRVHLIQKRDYLLTIAGIINEDYQDVGCALGRSGNGEFVWLRGLMSLTDYSFEWSSPDLGPKGSRDGRLFSFRAT